MSVRPGSLLYRPLRARSSTVAAGEVPRRRGRVLDARAGTQLPADPTVAYVALQALAALRARRGTAIGDAIDRALLVGRAARAAQVGHAEPSPVAILLSSHGTQMGYRCAAAGRLSERPVVGVPVFTVALGTREGVVQQPVRGGYKERITSRRTRLRSRKIATLIGMASSSPRSTQGAPEEGVREPRLAPRAYRRQSRELTDDRSPAGALSSPRPSLLLARLLGLSAALVAGESRDPRRARRRLPPSPSALALAAPGARAANECRGFPVCILRAGAVVVVPLKTGADASSVTYVLRRPVSARIVGGSGCARQRPLDRRRLPRTRGRRRARE